MDVTLKNLFWNQMGEALVNDRFLVTETMLTCVSKMLFFFSLPVLTKEVYIVFTCIHESLCNE